jgi:hypothetical protein
LVGGIKFSMFLFHTLMILFFPMQSSGRSHRS